MPGPLPETFAVPTDVPDATATVSIGADDDENHVGQDVVYDADGTPYVLPEEGSDDPYENVQPPPGYGAPGMPPGYGAPGMPPAPPEPWGPPAAPTAPPTFAVRPDGVGGHVATVSIPTRDGRTITARGRAKDARRATDAAVKTARDALDLKGVAVFISPAAQLAVRVASGVIQMAKDGKLNQIVGTLSSGFKKLASIFA